MSMLTLVRRRGRQFASWKYLPVLILSVILLFALICLFVRKPGIALIFLCYAIILFESRINLRRFIRGFPGASTLVTVLRSAFFFLPLPFLGVPHFLFFSWGILAGVLFGYLLHIWQWRDLQLQFSSEFLALLPPLSREEKFNGTLQRVLAGIAQEYFYRGVMLTALLGSIGWGAVAIAALLFALEHFMHRDWQQVFDWVDLVLQTLLGLGLGVILVLSSSLAGCMLGHIAYNSVDIFRALRRKTC